MNVTTTEANNIRVRGLNSITDDGGAVTISLHYNTTNDPLSSTTIEPVTPDISGTYNITNLSEKTNYYIWVSARDSFNNDTGLMPVSGAQPATTQGTPPTGLSGVSFSSATANSITLGGLEGITDASYPVQFTVKCRLTSVATDAVAAQAQATITAAGSTPTITIPGLSGDTRYYLWLEATDNLGTVANATLHTADIKTVNYDAWDFIVKQGAVSLFNIELDRVQWDGTEALTSSMFTYVRPGATTSNAGTPTVDLLLDSTIDTPFKWTPTAAPVGSTLFTIRTPIVATDPIWTLSWWKPRNRPGLEIKKNGVQFWIDPTLNLTGESPAPYPVRYPPYDSWEFKAVGLPGSTTTELPYVVISRFSWDKSPTLNASMITFTTPPVVVNDSSTTPITAQQALLDGDVNTRCRWIASDIVGKTLLKVTVPQDTSNPVWAINYRTLMFRPALAIYKNGVEVYRDAYYSTSSLIQTIDVQYLNTASNLVDINGIESIDGITVVPSSGTSIVVNGIDNIRDADGLSELHSVVRWRVKDTTTFTDGVATIGPTYLIDTLQGNTDYQIQVKTTDRLGAVTWFPSESTFYETRTPDATRL